MVDILFYIFAFVAIGSGIGVVMARNPVASLLFMVTALASIAGVYVLLEAHFLAAIQIMVYAGAIMVLFLFVIMLLNLGHDYQRDLRGGVWAILSFVITGALPAVPTAQAGLILLLQPTLATVWGVLFFDERLSALQVTGAIVTLAALYHGGLRMRQTG